LKRLKEFLTWKDIRKNAKQSDEATTVSNVTSTLPFEIGDVLDEEGEDETDSVSSKPTLTLPTTKSTSSLSTGKKPGEGAAASGSKKRGAYFYWDGLASLVAELTDGLVRDTDPLDCDLESEEIKEESRRRLREADQITRGMTKTEYMEFTECRQASFTYKKAKKFREWLAIPLAVTEYRLGDDVLEIVGFMASELVRKITEGALKIAQADSSSQQQIEEDAPFQGGLFKTPFKKSPILPRHIKAYVSQQLLLAKNNKLSLF
jgi:transcription initiation protein SPT3